MKHYLFTILLIPVIILSSGLYETKAQVFNDQAEWHYQTEFSVGAIPCDIGYQKLEITGDTLIQGHNCHIVSKTNNIPVVVDTEFDHEYLYESNDSIYWFNRFTQQFTLLYDFKANPGDSWNISVYDCILNVTVDSVKMANYDGLSRKNIYISDSNDYFTGKIIEGIGHTTSFFPGAFFAKCKYNPVPDGQYINGLRCFQNDSVFLNLKNVPCDTSYVVTSIEKINGPENIILYPNPTNGKANIKLNQTHKDIRLKIFTTTGQLIEQRQYENKQKIELQTTGLMPGVYLLELQAEDRPVLTKKLLVK